MSGQTIRCPGCPLCARAEHPGRFCFDEPAPIETDTQADLTRLREEISSAIVDCWRVAMTEEATVLSTAQRFADAALLAAVTATDKDLRADVARIAATCEAIASMPTENERAARCLSGVAASLRSALRKH